MKVRGQNLRIYVNGSVIAAALSCKVRLRAKTRELTHKDVVNWWQNSIIYDLSWSVEADEAVWVGDRPNDTSDMLNYRGQTVTLTLAMSDGENNADQGDVIAEGQAMLTDIRVTARNRARSTCSMFLRGKGRMRMGQMYLADCNDLVLKTSDGKLLTVWRA